MKKSTLKEAIKSKIKSLLSEDLMTTDEAFRVLRDMQNIYVDKRKKDLMGRAIDALQAAEVSRMMDNERTDFKDTGERAGFDMRGINESLNPEVTKALDRFITAMARKYGYEEQDAVYAIMAALEQRKSDTKYDMPGFGDTMDALDDISIREEEEPTSAELKKKDSIAATSNKLQKLTKKMKDIAGSYKRAKKANATNDMEKYVEQLKKMTKEKKQLEKAL